MAVAILAFVGDNATTGFGEVGSLASIFTATLYTDAAPMPERGAVHSSHLIA
jgi:hypothetical protein